MFEQLEAVANRLEELSVLLTRSEVVSDGERYTKLSKEYGQIEPVVSVYRAYRNAVKAKEEAAQGGDQGQARENTAGGAHRNSVLLSFLK